MNPYNLVATVVSRCCISLPMCAASPSSLELCWGLSSMTVSRGTTGVGHLRAEEVLDVGQVAQLPVDDQAVGQPAGLRALAAVGAAPAPRLGAEALPAACQPTDSPHNRSCSERDDFHGIRTKLQT